MQQTVPGQWELLYNKNAFVFETRATETYVGSSNGATDLCKSYLSILTQFWNEIGQRMIRNLAVEKLDKNGGIVST